MARETTASVTDTKAVRLRRLWRSRGTGIAMSGIARGRPVLPAPAEARALPARGLTARELIGMARAARGTKWSD